MFEAEPSQCIVSACGLRRRIRAGSADGRNIVEASASTAKRISLSIG